MSIKTAVWLRVDSLTGFVDRLLEGVGFGGGHAARGCCQGAPVLAAVGQLQSVNQIGHVLDLGRR